MMNVRSVERISSFSPRLSSPSSSSSSKRIRTVIDRRSMAALSITSALTTTSIPLLPLPLERKSVESSTMPSAHSLPPRWWSEGATSASSSLSFDLGLLHRPIYEYRDRLFEPNNHHPVGLLRPHHLRSHHLHRRRHDDDDGQPRRSFSTSAPSLSSSLERVEIRDFVASLDEEGRLLLGQELRVAREAEPPRGAEDEAAAAQPTQAQLRAVCTHSMLPFMGFGFLDNTLMIITGDYINTTFGVMLGISMMAAAGFGNCFADMAGIGCAHYTETLVLLLGFRAPRLSLKQKEMSVTRFAGNFGRAIGLTIGCLLGMFPLLFLDCQKGETCNVESKGEPGGKVDDGGGSGNDGGGEEMVVPATLVVVEMAEAATTEVTAESTTESPAEGVLVKAQLKDSS